jgi:hypothetical protein
MSEGTIISTPSEMIVRDQRGREIRANTDGVITPNNNAASYDWSAKLSSDITTTLNAGVAIAPFAWAPDNGVAYGLEGLLYIKTSDASNGGGVEMVYSGGVDVLEPGAIFAEYNFDTTMQQYASTVGGGLNYIDNGPFGAAKDAFVPTRISAFVKTDSTEGGSLAWKLRSTDIGETAVITLRKGSYLRAWKIDG